MASKEKVDIKRNEQFQEMDDELSKAMADLETTMERVTSLFESGNASEDGVQDDVSEEASAQDGEETPEESVSTDGDEGEATSDSE